MCFIVVCSILRKELISYNADQIVWHNIYTQKCDINNTHRHDHSHISNHYTSKVLYSVMYIFNLREQAFCTLVTENGIMCHHVISEVYISIRIASLCYVYPLELHFNIGKLGYAEIQFFLFLIQNIDCGYSLAPVLRCTNNQYFEQK